MHHAVLATGSLDTSGEGGVEWILSSDGLEVDTRPLILLKAAVDAAGADRAW